MRPQVSPDWGSMIRELMQHVSQHVIGETMGVTMTDRMVRHYCNGTQPPYWRGALLIDLWCKHTGKTAEDLPQCAVKDRRAARRDAKAQDHGPKMGSITGLVEWLKPKRGRPPGVKNTKKVAA